MKLFLCLFVATVYTALAVPVDQSFTENDLPRLIQFTDEADNLQTINLDDEIDNDVVDAAKRPESNQYFLFTRQNPTEPQGLINNNVESIKNSNFNAKNPTVVIAHGWMSSQETNLNPAIRDAYLGKSDTNVIVLDWRYLAVSNYISAAKGVPAVGRNLGKFLGFLTGVTGARLSSFHLVGFSLGAHLVGNAGRELGGRVARITGLDPAGPLWNLNHDRLNSDDAIYVEAIHTDGNTFEGLGIGSNVGDADFYPNGGESQPNCLTLICNHNRAWRFFAATVTYNHLEGRRCSNSVQLALGMCFGEKLLMGNDDLNKTGSGMYRLSTRRFYPY